MANSFEKYLEKNRKKSQILLSRFEENSRKIDYEIAKFRSCNLTSLISPIKSVIKNKSDNWRLRNDSSGVGGILCSNYFVPSTRRHSLPDMTIDVRVLIPSKKHSEPIVLRKPVKECYCYPEVQKMQYRSKRTKHKPMFPCDYCRKNYELQLKDNVHREIESPPMSCETVRKVQSITYIPKSKFLNNVQSKIAKDNYRSKILQSGDSPNITEIIRRREESPRSKTMSDKCEKCTRTVCSNNPISRKSSKGTLLTKKTITSKKSDTALPNSCPCCKRHNCYWCASTESPKRIENMESVYRGHGDTVNNSDARNRVQNLCKFREKNYFDTHGSSQSLSSSESSGSLEQYLLNERLFPQPAGKIHRKDLVVTMPPCATKQRKRVHYFPRHVVRQELGENMNKRNRYHSCPLTGHAIDLDVLKTNYPKNSLALRFQKRMP